MKRYEKGCHVLEKPFYTILELCEEWKDKFSISYLDLNDVFKNNTKNKIIYGINLNDFRTVALVKISDQYIPVAGCVINGVVSPSQPVINFAHHSLKDLEDIASEEGTDTLEEIKIFLRSQETRGIEYIQFLPGETEIIKWDEFKPTLVETESFKTNQKLKEDKGALDPAVQGRKPRMPPSFDESHKQGSLKFEHYNVEGNSIFNSKYLESNLHDFFRLQKNIDSWNPLQKKEVNWKELYFHFLSFNHLTLRVPHEDRMKIEKSFNSNQDTAKGRPQNIEGQSIETNTNKTSEIRVHQLRELINEVDIKLEKELGRKPSAIEVWKRLEEIQDDKNNCIDKIEYNLIYWKPLKGKPREFKYDNFESTLSQVRRNRHKK